MKNVAGLLAFAILFNSPAFAEEKCSTLFEKGENKTEKTEKSQNQLENDFLNKLRGHFRDRAAETSHPFDGAKKIHEKFQELNKKISEKKEVVPIRAFYDEIAKEGYGITARDMRFIIDEVEKAKKDGLLMNTWLSDFLGKLGDKQYLFKVELNGLRFGETKKESSWYDGSWWKEREKQREKEKEEDKKRERERKIKLEKEMKERKATALQKLQEILKSNRELEKAVIIDYQNLMKAKAANPDDPKIALTLGYGSAQDNEKSLALAHKIIEKFNGDGKILVDGDSPLANEIARINPSKTLVISGTERQFDGVESIVIKNDYSRMKLFKDASVTVMSKDSPVGYGVIFDDGNVTIYTPDSNWDPGIEEWAKDVPAYLGLPRFTDLKTKSNQDELAKKVNGDNFFSFKSSKKWKSDYSRSSAKNLEDMSASDLEDLVASAKSAEKDERKLTRDKNGNVYPGGAVVFGSSQNHHRYTKLLWEVTNFLGSRGVTIATGGSGGFMEVANDAAFSAGAHSIGIPIGGKSFLDTEKHVATGVQSATISTNGYEERIPYLLHRRKMIMFAPGGGGTMKELATTFFKLSKDMKSDDIVVFIGRDYYGNLVDRLHSSHLPKSLQSRIHLVDSVEDMKSLYEKYEASLQDKSELRTNKPPTPRNDHKSFRGESYEPKKYDFDSKKYNVPINFGPSKYFKDEDDDIGGYDL